MQFCTPDPLTTCQLSQVARMGNLQMVKDCLKKGHPLDIKDNRGWIALHQATMSGNIDCIKLLLKQKKCDVNSVSYEGETALLLACAHLQDVEVARTLIEGGVDVNIGNNEKETPLHLVCRNVKIEFIKLLLENGADINSQDFNSFTPLHEAINSYHLDTVKLLVNHGAELEIRDMYGRTPLFAACCDANRAVIEFLLKHNVDVNARTEDGSTPLMLVAQNCSLELVKMLLAHGANPNLSDNTNFLPLHFAAHNVNKELLQLLLDVTDPKAISTDRTVKGFMTITFLAIDGYSIECLQTLLNKGLDRSIYQASVPIPWAFPEDGEPLLKYPCTPPVSFLIIKSIDRYTMQMLKLLLEKGFPVNPQSIEEAPPIVVLSYESRNSSQGLITGCYNSLLKHGCDIDYRTNSYQLPDAVLVAFLSSNTIMLKLLLQNCLSLDFDILLSWMGDNLRKATPSCVQMVLKMGLNSVSALRKFSDKLRVHMELDSDVSWERILNTLDSQSIGSLQNHCRRAVRQWLWSVTKSSCKTREVLNSIGIPLIIQDFIIKPSIDR